MSHSSYNVDLAKSQFQLVVDAFEEVKRHLGGVKIVFDMFILVEGSLFSPVIRGEAELTTDFGAEFTADFGPS